MPFYNGTGPTGDGPMTGRGRGYCPGYTIPGFLYPGTWGGGRGRRYRYWTTGIPGRLPDTHRMPDHAQGIVHQAAILSPAEELGILRRQSSELKSHTEAINRRITELEQATAQSDDTGEEIL